MVKKQKFIFNDRDVEAKVKPGDTLLDAALRARLPLHHSCGGMGTCGTCRVVVIEGLKKLPPPNDIEQEIINDRGFSPSERLACQNEPKEDLIVEVPQRLLKES